MVISVMADLGARVPFKVIVAIFEIIKNRTNTYWHCTLTAHELLLAEAASQPPARTPPFGWEVDSFRDFRQSSFYLFTQKQRHKHMCMHCPRSGQNMTPHTRRARSRLIPGNSLLRPVLSKRQIVA